MPYFLPPGRGLIHATVSHSCLNPAALVSLLVAQGFVMKISKPHLVAMNPANVTSAPANRRIIRRSAIHTNHRWTGAWYLIKAGLSVLFFGRANLHFDLTPPAQQTAAASGEAHPSFPRRG